MSLPNDTFLLLSLVNTKLRDYYKDLDALCIDMNEDKKTIIERLESIGYKYDKNLNSFI